MTASPFQNLCAIAASVIHGVHGQPARLVPRWLAPGKGPNAAREIDPTRAEIECRVIRSESPERLSVSDNGVGRNPGMMRGAPTSMRSLVTFPEGMENAPRKGDWLIFADRPDRTYELGETLSGTAPGVTFAYSLRS
jgi:hypothetical protein